MFKWHSHQMWHECARVVHEDYLSCRANFLCCDVIAEKEFSQKRNQAVLFAGVIDGLSYLLDVNEQGSFKPKGTHFMVVCTEDMLRVNLLVQLCLGKLGRCVFPLLDLSCDLHRLLAYPVWRKSFVWSSNRLKTTNIMLSLLTSWELQVSDYAVHT